jgi:hypothetical protein
MSSILSEFYVIPRTDECIRPAPRASGLALETTAWCSHLSSCNYGASKEIRYKNNTIVVFHPFVLYVIFLEYIILDAGFRA